MTASVIGGMVMIHPVMPMLLRDNEAREAARRKYLKDQQHKKLEEKNTSGDADEVSDEENEDDDLRVGEAKVDESNQMEFAKVEKRVRTTGGGSTGTVREITSTETVVRLWTSSSLTSMFGRHLTRGKIFTCKQHLHKLELLYKNYKVIKEKLKTRAKDTIMEKHGNAASDC